MRPSRLFTCLSIVVFTLLTACQNQSDPVPIELGRDQCGHCSMMIVDGRYGGEIISPKGKVFKYDSIDCLAAAYREVEGQNPRVYVADFAVPGALILVEQAVLVEYETRSSPMGSKYIAVRSPEIAANVTRLEHPSLFTWRELLGKLGP